MPPWHSVALGYVVGLSLAAVGFAVGTGIISSGAIASLLQALGGERPRFSTLLDGKLSTPLIAPLIMASGPTSLLANGFRGLLRQPALGVFMVTGGLLWSFVQGVFIMTKVFGVD